MEVWRLWGGGVEAEGDNRGFTMRGIIVIFFFLVPSIRAVLGNFLLPSMIGAKDLAFPKVNLGSWYVFTVGGLFTMVTRLVLVLSPVSVPSVGVASA